MTTPPWLDNVFEIVKKMGIAHFEGDPRRCGRLAAGHFQASQNENKLVKTLNFQHKSY